MGTWLKNGLHSRPFFNYCICECILLFWFSTKKIIMIVRFFTKVIRLLVTTSFWTSSGQAVNKRDTKFHLFKKTLNWCFKEENSFKKNTSCIQKHSICSLHSITFCSRMHYFQDILFSNFKRVFFPIPTRIFIRKFTKC